MKRNASYYWLSGSLSFAAGFWGLVQTDIVWAPLLLVLGACIIALPSMPQKQQARQAMDVIPAFARNPEPHDSLHLARVFLSISYVARNEGLLALEKLIRRLKPCYHATLQTGVGMIMDGIDQAHIQNILRNTSFVLRHRIDFKVKTLKQISACLAFVGLAAGAAGGLAVFLRLSFGAMMTQESFLFLLVPAGIFLLLAIASLLLLTNAHTEGCANLRIHRQIMEGIRSVQEGDSYTEIVKNQSLYLSPSDMHALADHPLLDDPKIIVCNEKQFHELQQAIRSFLIGSEDQKG